MASMWQKRKHGVWFITYRENGKQRVRSLRTKDRREAQRLKRTIETMLDGGAAVTLNVSERMVPEDKDPLLDEFWISFNAWAIENRAARTVEEYKNWFTQLREFTKAERLGEIKRKDIEAFKAALTKQGKHKAEGVGLDRSSINNALKTFKSIWNHAIKLELFSGENPVAKVEPYRLPQIVDRSYLGKEELDALLAAAKGRDEEKYVRNLEARNVYLAIALMGLAGLRKREACFARWEWINWDRRIITVTNDERFTTKNRRPRTISLSAQLAEILWPYKERDGHMLLTCARRNNGRIEYRVDFRKGFHRACERVGIQATPHDLRHSFASRHAVAGTSIHVIAGWLGHSTTWTTQRYAHFQKTFNEAADNI